VDVRFEVSSTPAGATVRHNGEVLGVTPFSFTREREGDVPVELELTFELDGYQPHTVVARAQDGTVTVAQTLVKKPASAKRSPKGPKNPPTPAPLPGYKEDPYQ
jgi:hypothetical protein